MAQRQTRREFLHLLAAGTGAVALRAAAGAAGRPGRPLNFVFLLVDDMGFMDIGANNPRTFYETPNIDRLAKRGVLFTCGYAANPVCSPTRYSIMTGKYPTRVGATNFFSGKRAGRFNPAPLNDHMPAEEVTLGEAFREAGYSTAFLGKWHLGGASPYLPEDQGFDINVGGFGAGSPRSYFSPYRNPKLTDGPPGEHLPARLASEAIGILEKFKDGGKPFLLYLAFYSVHTPLQAPKDLIEKYRKKAAALADAEKAEFADEEQVLPGNRPRQVRTRQCHPTYAAMVESMDRQVGRVVDKLQELGLADSTAVIVMSDNGGLSTSEGSPTSNLPLRGGKGWLYEGGIREPFLIAWPGATNTGRKCDVPAISTDFYPTMLEMAALPARPAQHLDGVSLAGVLRGGDAPPARPLFWHYPHYSNQGGFPGAAVRLGDFKLIERFEDGRVHLYNLADDISERNDLADKMPQKVAELRALLHEWYKKVGAKFLQAKDGKEPWRPD